MEEKIQTTTWTHYVAACVEINELQASTAPKPHKTPPITNSYGFVFGETDTSRVHLLQEKTGILAQNWSRYRADERNPYGSTLKLVEQEIPGSLRVYKEGPDGALLWKALWSEDELELWNIAKSISGSVQFHQAWDSNKKNIYNYVQLERTGIYFAALTSYFEGLVEENNRGLIDVECLAAMLAAFRLGQFRREAASYQERLGRCLELSLTEETSVINILRGYGIESYLSQYVDKLIPHSEKHDTKIPTIDRGHAISNALENILSPFS